MRLEVKCAFTEPRDLSSTFLFPTKVTISRFLSDFFLKSHGNSRAAMTNDSAIFWGVEERYLDDVFSLICILKLPKSRPNCLKAARLEVVFMEKGLAV